MDRALPLVAVALLLTGCGRAGPDVWFGGTRTPGDSGAPQDIIDSDGDSLIDSDDPFPFDPDIDADFLDDLQERIAGTLSDNPDTDADGYRDGDEVLEGSDPTDAQFGIYIGGWPYNRFKDQIGSGAFSGPLSPGHTIGRHQAVDPFGQQVDLYDFGGAHQAYEKVLITAVAPGCTPCENAASWLAGGPDPDGLEATHAAVRAAVGDGSLLWVTVVSQTAGGQPGDPAAVNAWQSAYAHPEVPVLADPQSNIEASLGSAFPRAAILDSEDLQVLTVGALSEALSAL